MPAGTLGAGLGGKAREREERALRRTRQQVDLEFVGEKRSDSEKILKKIFPHSRGRRTKNPAFTDRAQREEKSF